MQSKEFKRFTLSLNMDNPFHRQVWAILEKIPKGNRTEYVCKKITGQQSKNELAQTVYENTLHALKDYGGNIQPTPVEETNLDEAEEISSNLFGFLASLK